MKCALYHIESPIRKSHIIPKFAVDFMKQTGSKYLRSYGNVNIRKQDGPTLDLLSHNAEQLIGRYENWFAKNIFYPYLSQSQKSFTYDVTFAKFIISLLWRALHTQLLEDDVNKDNRLDFLKDVEEQWRKFIKDDIYPIDYNDINIILTDAIESHNSDTLNTDLYLTRAIDITFVSNESKTQVAIYAKFLRFIFWSKVKGDLSPGKSDTKINFINGTLTIPQNISDDFIGNFLYNRIKEIDSINLPSSKQQRIIYDEIMKDEENFWKSDAARAMINDFYKKNE